GLIRLPGRNGDVGYAAPLAPDLASGKGVTIVTRPKIIYREVDDFGQMWRAHEHKQMEHRGVLHEAGDHPTMNSRQCGVSNVVLAFRQPKHHLVTQPQTFDADEPRIGHHLQECIVIVTGVSLTDQRIKIQPAHWRTAGTFLTVLLPPMRMNAPTTCAIGSLMSR